MGVEIKLREKVKDIKLLDKAESLTVKIRDATVKTKEQVTDNQHETSPTGYAENQAEMAAEKTANLAVHQMKNAAPKVREKVKEKRKVATELDTDFDENTKHKSRHENPSKPNETMKSVQRKGIQKQDIKTRQTVKKSIKQSAKFAGERTIKTGAKGTVKTAKKSVKTAEKAAKVAIKTAEKTAKATKQAAKATAKTAQRAAQTAKVAAKAAVATAKAAVKATIAMVKAIIAGTKALIAAIASGGWVAILIVLIVCMIGLIVGSSFGIFFSGEDTGTGQTMQTVIREINTEYEERLTEVKTSQTYDVLEMSGSRAVWKEVLSVYSVKTTTDPENAMDVATVDDTRKELLKAIFWDMHDISSSSVTKDETVIETSDGEKGEIVETEVSVTRTYLYITVKHKTADEMMVHYGFNSEQKKQLAELLSDEYADLWNMVLYGISNGSTDIVAVALSQVGNVGGEPYWSWYGFGGRVEWCACFVSWCANECGYIEAGIIPMFASCNGQGTPWFEKRGQYRDNSYIPMPGDIIFFDWDDKYGQDGNPDHVGIVERVEGDRIYTIEGNSDDACRQNSYPIGYYEIHGYGVPMY